MKSRLGRWFIIFGIIMLLYMVVFILIPGIRDFWQTPLGPELGLEPQTATPQASSPTADLLPTHTHPATTIIPTETETPTSQDDPDPTPVIFPTYTPSVYCGEQTEMIVLAVGLDARGYGFNYSRADVIRVVKVDFTIPSVSVLSFPRDLWVELPDTKEITESKLNQSYFFGTPGMGYYSGPGGGAGLLARTLSHNYGVQPEHYGVVNMVILEEMINAIGGVDIYLESTLDARDSPQSDDLWKIYNAGWNTLDGKRAVYYARIRKTDDVFERMDRQTEILCAVKDKLLSPSALMGIPDMVAAFSDNVLTDLSPAQLSQLACLAPQLKWENITFARLPEDELHAAMIDSPNMNGQEFIWSVDNQAIRNYVSGFLDGTWPPPPSEDEPDNSQNGETQMLCPEYPDR